MPLVLGGSSAVAAAYDVDNSCRFEDGDSSGLAKTFGTPTDRDKWTLSMWFKVCKIEEQGLFWATEDGSNYTFMGLESSGKFTFFGLLAGGASPEFKPSLVFRDPSAWYHFVIAWDSGQAVAADRINFYVNGTLYTGAFDTETYPAQDANSSINGALVHEIAEKDATAGHNFNGYMAETVFIDGTAYAASDFGEFDSDSPTIWKPKSVSALTFGNNGFWLDYKDSAAFGNDVSGNNNDFTPANLVAADQSQDSPTNNFSTLNRLTNSSNETLANGNNTASGTASDNGNVSSTLNPKAGKWYVETKITPGSGAYDDYYPKPGITQINTDGYGRLLNAAGSMAGQDPGTFYVEPVGTLVVDTVSSYFWMTDFTSGGNIGIAVDCDNGAAYVALNNTWQNSGDPTSGASKTGAAVTWTPADSDGIAFVSSDYSSSASEWNFGNGCFGDTVVTSAEADGNGYGLFEYAPPSGYLAICTKNLGSDGG